MNRNLLLLAGASMVLALVLAACAPATATTAPSTPTAPPATLGAASATAPAPAFANTGNLSVSFSADILPLFESRCASCHGGQRTEKALNLLSYTAVVKGSQNGPVIVAGDAAASKLATLVATGKMPKRGPKLTPVQIQFIVDWINAGALDN
ncbi:MAG TPA: cytochrome c [Anaerolineales bacterium]|jgi:mono/diheme cytochrome c family protein